jgi:hypothetical protein
MSLQTALELGRGAHVCCWQCEQAAKAALLQHELTAAKAVDTASAASRQHRAAAVIPMRGICDIVQLAGSGSWRLQVGATKRVQVCKWISLCCDVG